MKIKEIAEKKDKDLLKDLESLNLKLVKTRFEVASRETNNHAQVSKMKKDIARIKMILREREIQREEAKNEKEV